MLKHLSDLGMGSSVTLEIIIGEECQELLDSLLERCNKNNNSNSVMNSSGNNSSGSNGEDYLATEIVVSGALFAPAVNNVIWRLVTGRRTK